MTRAECVRQLLYDEGVVVFDHCPIKRKSIVSEDGYIGLSDQVECEAEEHCILTHDKWHLDLGAFYTVCSPFQLREQVEYRVQKRTLMQLVPPEIVRMYISVEMPLEYMLEELEVTLPVFCEAVTLYKELGLI